MWNAGLTKKPKPRIIKNVYALRREWKVCEDEQEKIKGTKKVAYPSMGEGDTSYI